MRIGRLFVYGCVAYALYSIATCSVCSSTSSEDAKARQKSEHTTSNTEDNIETKLGENNKKGGKRNNDNRNSDDDSDDDKRKENSGYEKRKGESEYKIGKEKVQPEDKLHQISKGIGDKINYAVDNITDNVSGHIKKKADEATKPYIEPWKELGAEVWRYGKILKNDYNNGKLLRD